MENPGDNFIHQQQNEYDCFDQFTKQIALQWLSYLLSGVQPFQ